MFINTTYLLSHAPGISFLCVVLAILVLGIVGILLSLLKVKSTWLVCLILLAAFTGTFISSTSLFGRLEGVKDDLYKKICLDVYTSSKYDDSSKTCYIRTISKNTKIIEIPIKEPSFRIIDVNDYLKELEEEQSAK